MWSTLFTTAPIAETRLALQIQHAQPPPSRFPSVAPLHRSRRVAPGRSRRVDLGCRAPGVDLESVISSSRRWRRLHPAGEVRTGLVDWSGLEGDQERWSPYFCGWSRYSHPPPADVLLRGVLGGVSGSIHRLGRPADSRPVPFACCDDPALPGKKCVQSQ